MSARTRYLDAVARVLRAAARAEGVTAMARVETVLSGDSERRGRMRDSCVRWLLSEGSLENAAVAAQSSANWSIMFSEQP